MDLSVLIDSWIPYLKQHQNFAYVALFFGSYFETVIGISFFVYGEFFFIIGGILAGMGVLNIGVVLLILFLGGMLGDFTSYFLGNKYGYKLYRKLEHVKYVNKYINEKNYNRGRAFFEKHGSKSIFLARLLGPIAWITPFLGGIYRLRLKSFLLFDILGVTVGIGQFVIAGYIFGINYERILPIISEYLIVVLLGIASILFLYRFWRKPERY
ncbi:DedA family protein [Candidatus Peregrinibacteria bacterium]|nr:MAG: DedA family protein [Candidatus Peregrinibacteria bacterium]